MAVTAKTNIPVVFGAMTFGDEGTEGARTHTAAEESAMLDLFQAHGHRSVDTAHIYANGTSETHLGSLEPSWQSRGLAMDSKLYPGPSPMRADTTDFTAAGLRAGVESILGALRADRIRTLYLHKPQRSVAVEETARGLQELFAEGKFERLGVSNFQAWEVAQLCEVCIRHGWVRPTVYQAVYSALHRAIEPELVPCLRRYGIALYTFAPLAGGILTGRYTRDQTEFEAGGRYDPNRAQGKHHQMRYLKDRVFDALDLLRPVAEKHGLTIAECALRWIQHHSELRPELGDHVIIGASNLKQLEQNLLDMEKGPLPQDVLDELIAGWKIIDSVQSNYWL